jgi:hypothetical protein
MLTRSPIVLALLSGLSVVGIVVLAATGHDVPDVLSAVALGAMGGASGAALPAPAPQQDAAAGAHEAV